MGGTVATVLCWFRLGTQPKGIGDSLREGADKVSQFWFRLGTQPKGIGDQPGPQGA